MALPNYDEMYRELLQILADMKVHKSSEITNILAVKFGVSDAERKEMLPSGRQAVFDNRVGWARTYLKKAGLIDSPTRGTYQLTARGKQVLAENPKVIDNHYLNQFNSFREFIKFAGEVSVKPNTAADSGQSPLDMRP